MTVTAVVTVVAGRHEHLRRQQTMLGRCHRRPDLVVVVAMGDPGVERIVAEGPFGDTAVMAHVESESAGLPLARARNVGAQAALARGSKLVVFLDVDCLPSPLLLDRYHDAATLHHGRDLLCGPVAYLPPLAPGQNTYGPSVLADARPHPARPVPPPGVLQAADDLRLFWSLSFAVDRATWHHIGCP
jgi:N-acetylglucosaminyl-diphospho-decaprenol L-rhamnosyltransferase